MSQSEKEILRDLWRNEDTLINHRISWLSGFQALLFGGLALCWGDPGKSVLVGLFCVLGFCLATLSYLSLAASTAAKGKLMVLWEKLGKSGTDDIGISATPYDSWSWKRYFAAWNLVPLLFAITWIFVLAVNLIQSAGPTGGGIPVTIKKHKKGDVIAPRPTEVTDWVILSADGTKEGGFTMDVIEKRRAKSEKSDVEKGE